jgi:hypothetical protein
MINQVSLVSFLESSADVFADDEVVVVDVVVDDNVVAAIVAVDARTSSVSLTCRKQCQAIFVTHQGSGLMIFQNFRASAALRMQESNAWL